MNLRYKQNKKAQGVLGGQLQSGLAILLIKNQMKEGNRSHKTPCENGAKGNDSSYNIPF